MKAERQHKECTSRVLQQSKGGGSLFVDNRPFFNNQSDSVKVLQAMFSTHRATLSSMATYLTATLANGTELCSNLSNSAAGHSEDRFIDEILPAHVADLSSTSDNLIFIGINRSPCTSTDYLGNGSPSCNKVGGALGCAERLIHLVTHGFAHGGTTYPIKLILSVRNLYGSTSAQQANSSEAIAAMIATGRILFDTQQLGGPSTRFQGTGAAKLLSK